MPSDEQRWKIPRMTDPLSRHWTQPPGLRDLVVLQPDGVHMPEHAWNRLMRYDRSSPSGTYPGKAWARQDKNGKKYFCWYGPWRGRGVRTLVEHCWPVKLY